MENKQLYREFVVSSELFHGYSVILNISEYSNLEEIASKVHKSLLNALSSLKLEILVEKLKNKHFHIHYMTLEQIKTCDSNHKCYICDGCPEN